MCYGRALIFPLEVHLMTSESEYVLPFLIQASPLRPQSLGPGNSRYLFRHPLLNYCPPPLPPHAIIPLPDVVTRVQRREAKMSPRRLTDQRVRGTKRTTSAPFSRPVPSLGFLSPFVPGIKGKYFISLLLIRLLLI